MDVLGEALSDFYNQRSGKLLWINTSYGAPEEMPVEVFFRDQEEMPDLELHALKRCEGLVLDIGAGVGSHTLLLQERGLEVSAIEISTKACDIMRSRGVKNVINKDIFDYKEDQYDTLLFLMNGIGLCGTVENLKALLKHCRSLLKPGGQIIFDSSDISYLYEDKNIRRPESYFGEVRFQYQYNNISDEWFNWLYIDPVTLNNIAGELSYKFELLMQDDQDQYLGRLYF
ncbi:class I SAM-dependent methyltransferase [Desertivirga arenae]|uniref:class I SAM-dependent methyltransferase n=1 Tax=Desertivirga arenae TaxID=2810309 RepID=UPI001A96E60F|nr:class I SAM-dependent methyltransferase [Pedobacter sp. SYSU D00823]